MSADVLVLVLNFVTDLATLLSCQISDTLDLDPYVPGSLARTLRPGPCSLGLCAKPVGLMSDSIALFGQSLEVATATRFPFTVEVDRSGRSLD